MNKSAGSDGSCGDRQLHEIRILGKLEARWADSLEGMTLTRESDGVTALTGWLEDQAALYGLLARLRDLGLPIVSFRRICARTPAQDGQDDTNKPTEEKDRTP